MVTVGGINGKLAVALQEETGADAILITSLDLFREANPPKAAVTSRLVSSGAEPRILWMDALKRNGIDYSKAEVSNCRHKIAHSVEMGFNFTRPAEKQMARMGEIVAKVEANIDALRTWERK